MNLNVECRKIFLEEEMQAQLQVTSYRLLDTGYRLRCARYI